MSDSIIAEIRAFNRFYTRQIGLLNEHVAKSRFSLAQAACSKISRDKATPPAPSWRRRSISIRPI